jgi:hypothetical protein
MVNVLAFLQWSSQRLLGYLHVHRLSSRSVSFLRQTAGTVDISTDANALLRLSLGYIGARVASLRGRQFHSPAIWTWVQRLAEFVSWQPLPFWFSIGRGSSFLKSGVRADVSQMVSLFSRHRAGILLYRGGIA